jgi:hypothetical protein
LSPRILRELGPKRWFSNLGMHQNHLDCFLFFQLKKNILTKTSYMCIIEIEKSQIGKAKIIIDHPVITIGNPCVTSSRQVHTMCAHVRSVDGILLWTCFLVEVWVHFSAASLSRSSHLRSSSQGPGKCPGMSGLLSVHCSGAQSMLTAGR